MNKISRKIIAQMPVKTENDIWEYKRALNKLKETEELVDKFEARFDAAMAKDGTREDKRVISSIVELEHIDQQDHRYDKQHTWASNMNGVKELTHHEYSQFNPYPGHENKHAFATLLQMESDPEHNTTEYSVTLTDWRFGKMRAGVNEMTDRYNMYKAEPTEYILASGEGEEREYRFSPLNRVEKLLQKAGDMASGVVEPFKKLSRFRISLGE